MRRLLFLTLVISFIIGFSACSQQRSEWAGKIEEIDGVTVVKNTKEPIFSDEVFNLVEDLSIGKVEGQEEYIFSQISAVDVDDNERIYVADMLPAHIKVFDRNGEYLRTIGRKGQGPGEMQMPYFVQITSENEVLVQDLGTQRIIYFTPDGEFLRQKPIGTTRFPILIKADSYGNFIGIVSLAPPPIGGKIINKYDSNFNILMLIVEDEQGTKGVLDIAKISCFCDVSPNDNVIWGNSKEYVLHILNPEGLLIKRIIKDSDPLKFTENDKDMYKERYADAEKRGLVLNFPGHYPEFKDIFADDKERIFVQTYQRIEGEKSFFFHDVFDADGKYIAKVPVLANLNRNAVWKKDKLYTIDEDDNGLPLIKRYKVTWNY
jgi:hypothetical protein